MNSQSLPYKSYRGFSLIELMIAMGLGIFLVTALMSILVDGKRSFTAADHLSRLQENGRISINMISADLRRAGYMGGNSDMTSIEGTAGYSTNAISCDRLNTSWGTMILQPLVGLNDTHVGYDCIAGSEYLRGDILTARYASPWISTASNGVWKTNQLYLRSSLFSGKIFLGSEQASLDNQVDAQPQSVHDLVTHSYFVSDSGRACNGAAVPSLYRMTLGSTGLPVARELIPGIENFQVQYHIGNQYFNADDIQLNDWNQVTAIRVWLLARSECAEVGFIDQKTYSFADQNYTPEDNFRRQLYTTTVTLRN